MARHLDDWIAETPESIAARLEAAREAQRQTRFTLGLLAVISMMMLILAYNAYLSFDSRCILDPSRHVDESRMAQLSQESDSRSADAPAGPQEEARERPNFKPADSADTVPDVLTIQALQDWAESRNAT